MTGERRQFEVRQQADVTVVVLRQRGYADTDVLELESNLLDLVRGSRPRKLLVDMGSLEITTNAIHGVLLKAKKALARHGGVLKLCNLAPPVIEVFRMLRLVDNVFEVRDSADEAIEEFAEDG